MQPEPQRFTRGREFLAGCRGELPILLGVAPFGMIYGLLALSAGLTPGVAQSMSCIVFAGSAQFITAQLVHERAPGGVIVLTVLVVNLRHALYSASVAPYLRPLGRGWKAGLAYLLTDEAYAVAITRYLRDGNRTEVSPYRHWYFLGAGLTLWTAWQWSTAVGIFVGARLPSSWSLDFTLALTFIALVVPSLRTRAGAAAAIAAGTLAVAGAALPYKLALPLAALGGVLAGLGLESLRDEAPAGGRTA